MRNVLGFFRRHQKIFFYFVTGIVVITMTCFGSMWRFQGPTKGDDPVAFHAIDGSAIRQQQLAHMTVFLASDAEDKLQLGGIWGPNFLNDGVVRNDLLESGLGTMLATAYIDLLLPDLRTRQEKEKHYTPYTHAHARFLGAESVWSSYAPTLLEHYQALKNATDPSTSETFSSRVALYLAEQQFPQMALKQVLRHQESQYQWLPQDPYLFRQDLALFGYHSIEDWFGPRFVTLAAELIINASALAAQEGYSVSATEAWTELRRQAEQSFARNRHSPYLDVSSPEEYMEQQLRYMGMDRETAISCWQSVMLFRRLFHAAGNAALVDRLGFEKFSEFANQRADLTVYTLSSDLHLPNYQALQAFECYLDAVASRDRSDPLALPQNFRTVDAVKEQAPELVKRQYLLEIAQVQRAAVALRIPVRELWSTELEADNWEEITDRFPTLSSAACSSKKERLQAIDTLDRHARKQLDIWAQEHIIAAHPEWIEEALDEIEPREIALGLTAVGGTLPFAGVKDREVLGTLLDAGAPISGYTEDGDLYTRIHVLERAEQEEILTFQEAQETGALNTTLCRMLGASEREREAAANKKYGTLLEAVYRSAISSEPWDTELPDSATGEYAAKHRFRAHLEQVRADVQQHGEESAWIANRAATPLLRQWCVCPLQRTVHRHTHNPFGHTKPFAMEVDSWSPVMVADRGTPYFFHVQGRSQGHLQNNTIIDRGQQALAQDARRCYMQRLLSTLQAKEALAHSGSFPHE